MKKKTPTSATQINKVKRCCASGGKNAVKDFLENTGGGLQAGVREYTNDVIDAFKAREPKSRFDVKVKKPKR